MMDRNSLDHYRKLISEGKLDQCLQLLLAHMDQASDLRTNDLHLLSAQYHTFIYNKSMGIENDSSELNRITKAVLDIVTSEEVALQQPDIKNRISMLSPKHFLWGGAFLILVLIILVVSSVTKNETHGIQSPIINGNNNKLLFEQKDTTLSHAKD